MSEVAHCSPFFLDAGGRRLFALWVAPAEMSMVRRAVLYVHPLGDEMNKSRRMAARQARLLAGRGVGVLLLDLYGCGDSEGDFADARLPLWLDDLHHALDWLQSRVDGDTWLLGLRLGGLLAMRLAHERSVAGVVLWQPAVDGESSLRQFLRLETARGGLAGGNGVGVGELLSRLEAGEAVEVAGYRLSAPLAAGLRGLRLVELGVAGRPVYWFGVSSEPPPVLRQAWREAFVALEYRAVSCEPFWTTAEICECPALLETTSRVLEVA
jgi:exosortase A-associated hydrolase 2